MYRWFPIASRHVLQRKKSDQNIFSLLKREKVVLQFHVDAYLHSGTKVCVCSLRKWRVTSSAKGCGWRCKREKKRCQAEVKFLILLSVYLYAQFYHFFFNFNDVIGRKRLPLGAWWCDVIMVLRLVLAVVCCCSLTFAQNEG